MEICKRQIARDEVGNESQKRKVVSGKLQETKLEMKIRKGNL